MYQLRGSSGTQFINPINLTGRGCVPGSPEEA
ncbi:MAG: hypothetical protein JWO49_1803 [Arthrobacter sp.]|nr:hypothetical protein [Arthrobacter sp.]MCU1548937.1 hypothetical protein [Arthrobacter sp.]